MTLEVFALLNGMECNHYTAIADTVACTLCERVAVGRSVVVVAVVVATNQQVFLSIFPCLSVYFSCLSDTSEWESERFYYYFRVTSKREIEKFLHFSTVSLCSPASLFPSISFQIGENWLFSFSPRDAWRLDDAKVEIKIYIQYKKKKFSGTTLFSSIWMEFNEKFAASE